MKYKFIWTKKNQNNKNMIQMNKNIVSSNGQNNSWNKQKYMFKWTKNCSNEKNLLKWIKHDS